MQESNILLLDNIEKMILHLTKYAMRRPIHPYIKLIKLDTKNKSLYNTLLKTKHKLANLFKNCPTTQSQPQSITDINNTIISHHIKNNKPNDLIDFITAIRQPLSKSIIEKIIEFNATIIANEIISNEMIDNYLIYHLILMMENIDIIPTMKTVFDISIAINYLKDIVIKSKIKSLEYLLMHDPTIISTIFENDNNILHIIPPIINEQNSKIIEMVIRDAPELLSRSNSAGDAPLIHHAKNNPTILHIFIEYPCDFTIVDKAGNSCLHYICKHNEPKLLKKILCKFPVLMNIPNINFEYPIIICCKEKQEEMFYVLKNFDADMFAKDTYGNTAYHYICANSICIGMMIQNIQNYFGATPRDYCKLSHDYYTFTQNLPSCYPNQV